MNVVLDEVKRLMALVQLMASLDELAEEKADGHYTVLSFTGGFRVGLGTPSRSVKCPLKAYRQVPQHSDIIDAISECIINGHSFYDNEPECLDSNCPFCR